MFSKFKKKKPLAGDASVNPETKITTSNKGARITYQYFDPITCRWVDFSPHGNPAEGSTDGFRIFYRYSRKSESASRRAFILPQSRLVSALQNIISHLDWRNEGEFLVLLACKHTAPDLRLKHTFYTVHCQNYKVQSKI